VTSLISLVISAAKTGGERLIMTRHGIHKGSFANVGQKKVVRLQATARKTRSKVPPTSQRKSGITTFPETGTRMSSRAMTL
jgi:hypothetical protein